MSAVAPVVSPETAIAQAMSVSGLPELVFEWIDDCRIGRGISDHTESAYRSDLTAWGRGVADVLGRQIPAFELHCDSAGRLRHVLSRIELEELSAENLRRATAVLVRMEYAAASRRRMLGSLKRFCRWAVIRGYLSSDPTITLEAPLVPPGLPAAFLASELEAIVEVASEQDPNARFPWPARDRALVAILAGAGLRAAELIGLRVADVIRETPVVLRVTGKGRRQRRVPIPVEVLAAIDDYLAERRRRFRAVDPTDALMVRYNNTPMTKGALNYLVLRWVKRAGVIKPDGEAAHAFRHTYAKGLVANGVPLSSVQALLGHADLSATQIYLRMTGGELASAVESAEVREYLRSHSVVEKGSAA